ncbi:MAG: hypothetical protein HOD26_06370 [Gammaproteobacteria bacterium]|nr:hypothetical protein [Gammaproteobacteria bacterium]
MKKFQEFNENEEDLLHEGKSLRAVSLVLRGKQSVYSRSIKQTKDIEKKIDILSEQMTSQSTLLLAALYSLSNDMSGKKA